MRCVLFDDLAISCVIYDAIIDYTEENIDYIYTIYIYTYKITFYIIISVICY